jgi:DinB family protein
MNFASRVAPTLLRAAVAILIFAAFATPAHAQQDQAIPKTTAESIGGILSYTEEQFFSVAQAMPAEKYPYIPTAPGGKFDGVRSFAEQVKHVACANFAFFNEIEGKTPPDACEKGGPAPAKTKPELLQYLRDSFDYGNKVLATLNAQNSMDRVEGRYGGPNTKLGMAVIAVWHIADHYGQIVYYVRLNGIVPPPTQRQGLQVR